MDPSFSIFFVFFWAKTIECLATHFFSGIYECMCMKSNGMCEEYHLSSSGKTHGNPRSPGEFLEYDCGISIAKGRLALL